jgi:EAL domain-containing protein (putative c-di-GMP-specific phosphodiesterase class I)
MANAEQAATKLQALREMGVSLAIDDFGTGYSSLAYLKRLPITTLKIDKTFVTDLNRDPDDTAITTTVITMAHSLGLTVVAEGVETETQLRFLDHFRCDEVQGYWLSRPAPPDACLQFIRGWDPARIAGAGALVLPAAGDHA